MRTLSFACGNLCVEAEVYGEVEFCVKVEACLEIKFYVEVEF